MSAIHSIKKFFNQISNLKNWTEYSYHKKKMRTGNLVLITKANPIAMKMDYDAYLVFKEIFIEDFYKIKLMLIEAHPLDDDKLNNNSLINFLHQKGFSTTSKKFKNNCYYTFAINLFNNA